MNSHWRSIVALVVLSAPVLGGADGKCDAAPGDALVDGSSGETEGGTCAAQDAAGQGACRAAFGYKWDGAACVLIGGCECVGAACGALFSSPEACAEAHAHCGSKCAVEIAAVSAFVQANKACATDHDCQLARVGCGYTEDGCTGAVYVNRDTDLAALRALSVELFQCDHGGDECGSCRRALMPPECARGKCQRATP